MDESLGTASTPLLLENSAVRKRRRRLAIISSAAITLAAVSVTVAWALVTDNIVPTTNYSPTCAAGGESGNGPVCRTDNASVAYYMESSLETSDKDIVRIVIGRLNSTDLNVSESASPVYSGDGETDVIYKESSVAPGLLGATWCNDPVGTHTCDQQYVDIESYLGAITCHETGHAVGLLHGNNASPTLNAGDDRLGCMQNPVPSAAIYFDDNQVDNINGAY